MSKTYSVAEIAALRLAVMALQPGGAAKANPLVVEEQLRTYLQYGTYPDELVAAATEEKRQRLEFTERHGALEPTRTFFGRKG